MDAELAAELMLVVGVVVLAAVAGIRLASRFGLPGLLFYLGLGLLISDDGIGGVAFDNAELATALGYGGLVIILAEGGLTTRPSTVRPVIVPAGILASVGVALSIFLVALPLSWIVGLDLRVAVLIGAVLRADRCRRGVHRRARPAPARAPADPAGGRVRAQRCPRGRAGRPAVDHRGQRDARLADPGDRDRGAHRWAAHRGAGRAVRPMAAASVGPARRGALPGGRDRPVHAQLRIGGRAAHIGIRRGVRHCPDPGRVPIAAPQVGPGVR